MLYTLLLIFGVLSTQSLFVGAANISEHHCGEFNHIHIYKLSNAAHANAAEHNKAMQSSQNSDNDDSDCHSLQNLASTYIQQIVYFDFKIVLPSSHFITTFSENNNFKSPYLEPFRKPPRNI